MAFVPSARDSVSGKPQRLGHSECELVRLDCPLVLARQGQAPSKPRRQVGDVGVGLVRRHGLEGLLHSSQALSPRPVTTSRLPSRPETRAAACSSPACVEELERRAQTLARRRPYSALLYGLDAGLLEQERPLDRLVRELRGLLVGAACLSERAERACALGGPGEELSRSRLDLGRVVGVGLGLVGGDVVRGDDLDDLLLRGAEARSSWAAAARWRVLRSRRASVS